MQLFTLSSLGFLLSARCWRKLATSFRRVMPLAQQGHSTAAALPLAAPAGGEVGEVTNAAPAASTSRLVAPLRAASDIIDPNLTGIVSPRLANVQRAMGRAADALEARSAPVVKAQAAVKTPQEAVPAAQYVKALKEGNSPQTARMLASEAKKDAPKAASNMPRNVARANFLNRPVTNAAQAQQAASERSGQYSARTLRPRLSLRSIFSSGRAIPNRRKRFLMIFSMKRQCSKR